jgi:hypothetical protein
MLQVRSSWTDTLFVFPLEKTGAEKAEPLSTNVWLFTDPLAKAVYAQQGKLQSLEQDIRTFAMFQDRWGPDEIDFKLQIDILVQARVLAPGSSFANVSPHPTIYKALRPGKIEVRGERYHFQSGDEIVFASWPERVSHPGIRGPLRIGRFAVSDSVCLCSQAYPQLAGLSCKDFEVLHQIACYQKRQR